ncbi:MAG: four helix bundle protein [Chloroflexia bacterium]
MVIQSYRDLLVWQKSMDLVAEIYCLAKLFPREEQFGLISQIQRAAVSVPANIARGHGRIYKADFLRHLSIARGSFSEVKTYVKIAVRLKYVEREQVKDAWALMQEVGRLLNGLIRSMGKASRNPSTNNRIFEETDSYEPDFPDLPNP